MRIYFLFLLSAIFSFNFLQAQLFIPLGNDAYDLFNRIEIKSGGTFLSNFHSSIKEFSFEDVLPLLEKATFGNSIDSLDANAFSELAFFYNLDKGKRKKPLLKHFYSQNAALYSINAAGFKLIVNPVIYFAGAYEIGNKAGSHFDRALFINTRGATFQGIIDDKISFYTFLTDNQMRVPLQTSLLGESTFALPGESYFKKFKTNGVDFFHAEGYVAAPVTKHISMQFGTTKHFIGDGIRSLILSDFSKPKLTLRIITKVWKLEYQNLFYELTDSAFATTSGSYKKKYGATHHISINVTNKLNLGFFETVIFKREGNNFELNYLNPVIFYRAVEHSLGSPDNVLVGMDYKLNIKKRAQLYGQLVLDEFLMVALRTQFFSSRSNSEWGWWGNKYAIQMGAKFVDVFRTPSLDFQLEYNHIRPYTYAYTSPALNYTDFNQSMAHPLGANLKEIMADIKFKPSSRLLMQIRCFIAKSGLDTLSSISYGADLLKSTHQKPFSYGNYTAQGLNSILTFFECGLSYKLATQLYVDFTYSSRKRIANNINYLVSNNYLMLGIRLNSGKRNFMY